MSTPLSAKPQPSAHGLEITAPVSGAQGAILTQDALHFVARLAAEFEGRRQELLERRRVRQREIDTGHFPDFLPETASIRQAEWRVTPIPRDLLDRRVEITGPVDRKMVINALNYGASVFMADFEDAKRSSTRCRLLIWRLPFSNRIVPACQAAWSR
jgi:malate synthase